MKQSIPIWFLLALIFMVVSCKNNRTEQNALQTEEINASSSKCIDKILQIDASLGKIRNHQCEKITLSKTIKAYTKGIENLNFEDCPATFTKAFESHRIAWVDMMVITDKYPILRGEMHDLFDDLEEGEDGAEFRVLLKSIWDTWEEIEQASK